MEFSTNFIAHFITAFLLLNLYASYAQLPYMTSDVNEVAGKSYDYIIVGGGTAGCSLAATLSEKFSVLVVERGGSPYGNPLLTERRFTGFPNGQSDEFSSVSQSFTSKEGTTLYRGRVLGGTSTINGGFFSKASRQYVRKAGWDRELVEESYKWVASKVAFQPNLTTTQSAIKFGLIEAGIIPYNGFTLEHIVGTKISDTIFDESGTRHSAADLLMAGNPDNIVVLLNATVKNIILNNKSIGYGKKIMASGIRFMKSNGSTDMTYDAYIRQSKKWGDCGGDVILSAGAIGSPQILMLSGIGPQEQLRSQSIPVVLNLKGVGQTMQDNPAITILAQSKPEYRFSDPPQVAGITNGFKYIVQGGILVLSPNLTMLQVSSKIAAPESTGTLQLNNTDPRKNPIVQFNYLATKKDLEGCIEIAQTVDRVITSRAIGQFLGSRPQSITVANKDLRKYCKDNLRSYFHYHGGCTVGSVVDAEHRVYGVKGLRVLDGSTFAESPGTNPMATLMMLGRYQGIKMIRERKFF